jgi:uncharacterized protein with HEPN domain
MPTRKNLLLLEDILNAAEKIIYYTYDVSFEDFMDTNEKMDAVVLNFLIIGEAASRISKEFQIYNRDIPWSHIISFRNCLVHEYFQIDYEMVWKIKESSLPPLVEAVGNIVDDLYSRPDE